MDNNQVWDLTEILENISNSITELKDNFDAGSKLNIQILGICNENISDSNKLKAVLNNLEYRSALLTNINDVIDLRNQYDPQFLNRLEILKEMTNMCKVGIVLAKKEGKEII
jgi:hypothetical protein